MESTLEMENLLESGTQIQDRVCKPQRTTEYQATAHTEEDPGKLQEGHKD